MEFRSILFVPAKADKMKKIKEINADAFIIDLEDSMEEQEKKNALLRVESFLDAKEIDYPRVIVRINKDNYFNEATFLQRFPVGFMLPKFENFTDYEKCKTVWEEHRVYSLIETPIGLVNLTKMENPKWIDAFCFGAQDYTSKVGMKDDYKLLKYQKSLIVTWARALQVKVYDTPSFQIKSDNLFHEELENTMDLGFDGKLAIHPKHIELINKAYEGKKIAYFKQVISEYNKSKQAVFVYDGVVYEKMHIEQMMNKVKKDI